MKTLLITCLLSLPILSFGGVQEFNAYLTGKAVHVEWVTQGENVQTYVIQKSRNNKRFKDVVEVNSGENSNLVHYFDVDNKPWRGVSYYRVKQVDQEGIVSYSNVVVVKNKKIKSKKAKSIESKEVLIVVEDQNGAEKYSKVKIESTRPKVKAVSVDKNLEKGQYRIIAASQDVIRNKEVKIE